MVSNFLLRSFRILLFPFSLLYWLGLVIRNFLYDRKWLSSSRFGLPLICIGNLSVGGTGKSPMVEWLLEQLRGKFRLATLSRGYKRKTRGYSLAAAGSTALDIGDEPMMFHLKFPDIPVAVGEERVVAIPQLLHDKPDTEAILLDDAFQHRQITAGYNILLTDYHNLFTRDFYMPTGDLRDLRKSYRRAQSIVVTKCPADLSTQERDKIITEIKPLENQQVFFTSLEYGPIYAISDRSVYHLKPETEVLLITGIANPRPLKNWLEERVHSYHYQQYPDHHIFSIDDLRDIRKKFQHLNGADKIILTTEKDAVRLEKFKNEFDSLSLYIVPIRHNFLFNGAVPFTGTVTDFIRNFKRGV
jgi:tetraacyldisaccharide 4'-kinase